tara:strand:- start:223 stop:420 length:198 start_codon:yes stop_codon:yes gene_type:complete
MKLSECKRGEIVTNESGRIGHVVGLAYQYEWEKEGTRGEVVPVVEWVGDAVPSKIHHGNIQLYKD